MYLLHKSAVLTTLTDHLKKRHFQYPINLHLVVFLGLQYKLTSYIVFKCIHEYKPNDSVFHLHWKYRVVVSKASQQKQW